MHVYYGIFKTKNVLNKIDVYINLEDQRDKP